MFSRRGAFTLVELLVVVAIIGTLTALLLPAVQAARESGRKSECQNNLKQLCTALQVHVAGKRRLPSGGWGNEWVGVPGRGSGKRQPGGWVYSLLPFLEQTDLHNLGAQLPVAEADAAYSVRLETPLPLFVCPTRRSCATWELASSHSGSFRPYGHPERVARSDYAINAGSSQSWSFPGPATLELGDSASYWRDKLIEDKVVTGVCHLKVGVGMESIIDGTANTYLVGEKMISPDCYENGKSIGDNDGMYTGYSNDLHRFAGNAPSDPPWMAPLPDGPENSVDPRGYLRFGSAHTTGLFMAYCDGSVRFVGYDVDEEVHFRAGHRRDGGEPIEGI